MGKYLIIDNMTHALTWGPIELIRSIFKEYAGCNYISMHAYVL